MEIKKILMLIVFPIMLSGCGVYSEDNWGMGWDYDFKTPLGIRYSLRHGNQTFTPEEIDNNLREVAECMGYQIPNEVDLMIVVVDQPDLVTIGGSPGGWGVFRSYPNLIGIWGGTHSNEFFRVNHNMKHEFAHAILYAMNGHADDGHNNHIARACINGYD